MKWFPASLREGNNFDLMRLGLAVSVIYSHSFPLLYGNEACEPLKRLSGGERGISIGTLAVDGFFLISGFLIAHSWIRSRGIIDFAKRRVLRIVPGYAVAVIVSIFVFGILGADNARRYLSDLHFRSLLLRIATIRYFNPAHTFQHVPTASVLNGSLWTIPIELRCYALLALVGLCGLMRRLPLLVVFLLTLGIAMAAHETTIQLWRSNGPIAVILGTRPEAYMVFIACFFSGAGFYLWRERIPNSPVIAILAACVLAAAFFTAHGITLAIPTAGAYLLLFVAFLPTPLLQNLTHHQDISYGVYLYAYPIQQTLVKFLGHGFGPASLFLLAVPPTVAMAVLSWMLIERPLLPSERKRRMGTPEGMDLVPPPPLPRPAQPRFRATEKMFLQRRSHASFAMHDAASIRSTAR